MANKIIKTNLYLFYEQITCLGGLFFYCFLLILLLMVGEFDLSAELMLSLFCVMALAIISKLLFFKERPVRQEKNNIIERIDASSFPSIHSMRVSSLVFWLSLYFNNVIMTCYFAVIGLMVVYSRVFLKKHFIIDVIFGIIFSIVINMLLWWFI